MRRLFLNMNTLMLAVALFLTSASFAQSRWCVVDAEKPNAPVALMSNVACLLTNDWTEQLTLMCKDGSLHGGFKSISFRQFDLSAVRLPEAQEGTALLASPVSEQLTLTGCKAGTTIHVYHLSGRELYKLETKEGKTEIQVGNLPAGVYLLRVGETTIKFMKK